MQALLVVALCVFALGVDAFRLGNHRCRKLSSSSSALSMGASNGKAPFSLLVLGGTGFVGREVIRRARAKGMSVVSISRRGKLLGETDESVTWVSGDAAESKTLEAVISDFGPFDGCVHAIGVLFDSQSRLRALNRFASGSGSRVDASSTYDRVIRQTGAAAVDAFVSNSLSSTETPKPYVLC